MSKVQTSHASRESPAVKLALSAVSPTNPTDQVSRRPSYGIFSGTKFVERAGLGRRATEWLAQRPGTLRRATCVQSSDESFHCTTILLSCEEDAAGPSDDQTLRNVNVVEIFGATLARERDGIGEQVSDWVRRNPKLSVAREVMLQSSDQSFHCVSVVLFCVGTVTVPAAQVREEYKISHTGSPHQRLPPLP